MSIWAVSVQWLVKNKIIKLTMLSICLVTFAPLNVSADQTIQSSICAQFIAPTLTAPIDGSEINQSSVVVSGTGEPGMTVTILGDGQTIGATTVVPDGSYALEVPLSVGFTTLVAREINDCDTVQDSNAATVYRPAPPVDPVPPDNGGSPEPNAPGEPSPSPLPALRYPSLNEYYRKQQSVVPGYSKPIISWPADESTVSADVIWVGGKAEPGSIVTIFVNGERMAYVVASPEGTYRAFVGLQLGDNSIQVRSELNGRSANSDSIKVTYVKKEIVFGFLEKHIAIDAITLLALAAISLSVLWAINARHGKLK